VNGFEELRVHIPTTAAGLDDALISTFIALVVREPARYRAVLSEHWPTAAPALEARDLEDSRFRGYGYHRALLIASGTLRHLDLGHGYIRATVAAADDALAAEAMREIKEAYPPALPKAGPTVGMVFWALGETGPISFRRDVAVPEWAAVRGNYPRRVLDVLDPLIAWDAPAAGGQLLLWHGLPGTGKTWAIRAMASEWRAWCQFEYITDPDRLFDRAAYLTQVLLEAGQAGEDAPQWRCLILEDTGELLAADAKAQQGQALSRLLNVVDGLLGQGLRLLLLITTNEELKTLHPAVTRPGRCLYQMTFQPFRADEAESWLARRRCEMNGYGRPTMTLAELYQHAERFPVQDAVKPRVGF